MHTGNKNMYDGVNEWLAWEILKKTNFEKQQFFFHFGRQFYKTLSVLLSNHKISDQTKKMIKMQFMWWTR